jgi:general secretion pathway protein D
MPTSNLIGKIRFIPVHRSKALLVLAPPEYLEDITNMIQVLDQPGKQVMVKAVIVEIDHTDMTSLGIQLAASTSAFGTLEENALNVLNALTNTETRGSLQLTTTANINVLVDLLVKKANARVLNQPTLWTKDNEEAVFIKGQEVPFVEGSQTDTTGTSIKEAVKYSDVGVTLRIRPNITPEKAVDMTIDLEISEVAGELVNNQIAVDKLNTTTHLIVDDGETILLGGILFQKDSDVKRKVPLLGDIPIVGGLFSHESTLKSNNELLIFITPYVMDDDTTDEAIRQIEEPKKKMQIIMQQMDEWLMTDNKSMNQTGPAAQENAD